MARSISKEVLEQKIEKVKQSISRNREQYENLTTELEKLHKKRKALQSEEIMKAIAKSSRSYDEILEFIQGTNENEEEQASAAKEQVGFKNSTSIEVLNIFQS